MFALASLFRRSRFALSSLSFRSFVALVSLFRRSRFALSSLSFRSFVALSSLFRRSRFALASLSLRSRFALASLSLRSRFALASLSLRFARPFPLAHLQHADLPPPLFHPPVSVPDLEEIAAHKVVDNVLQPRCDRMPVRKNANTRRQSAHRHVIRKRAHPDSDVYQSIYTRALDGVLRLDRVEHVQQVHLPSHMSEQRGRAARTKGSAGGHVGWAGTSVSGKRKVESEFRASGSRAFCAKERFKTRPHTCGDAVCSNTPFANEERQNAATHMCEQKGMR